MSESYDLVVIGTRGAAFADFMTTTRAGLRQPAAVLAVLGVLLAACGSAAQTSAPVPPGPPSDDVRVGLAEFRLVLSAGALSSGAVTVRATNAGSTAHDLRLRQGDRVLGATALLSPGGRETLRVEVAPGEPVQLDCTVPGHAEAGMRATVPVNG